MNRDTNSPENPLDFVDLVDSAKGCVQEFFLWPEGWDSFHCPVSLSWNIVKFDKDEFINVPEEPGVYGFLINPCIANNLSTSYLIYIGKADNLRRRFRQYPGEINNILGRPKLRYLLNKYKNYAYFTYSIVPNSLDPIEIENSLIHALIPPANTRLTADISSVVNAF